MNTRQGVTPLRVFEQEGIISRIGTDYVDLQQSDDTTIRVLTKLITNIKWIDPQ